MKEINAFQRCVLSFKDQIIFGGGFNIDGLMDFYAYEITSKIINYKIFNPQSFQTSVALQEKDTKIRFMPLRYGKCNPKW